MIEREKGIEDVTAILAEAAAAVKAANVPEEFQQAAFSKAVDVITARRTAVRPMGTSTEVALSGLESVPRGPEIRMGGGMLDRVAARLKLHRDIVGEVFDDSDGKIDLILPSRRLDTKKASATKQLALIVVAARQAAEIEEWTDVDEIRRFADDFKRYDPANFASSIREMHEDFRFKQVGRKILVKLGRPGWDHAAELVRMLSGEE